jgi:DNA repair protein RecO (recombination protein O)
MEWQDEGFVVAVKPHGETSLVLHLLTAQQGRHAGLVRGARRGRNRANYEIGNRLNVRWRARLAEHLGNFTGELVKGYAALVLEDADRLAGLAAAAALVEGSLPERDPMPRIFDAFAGLVEALAGAANWPARYVAFELELLAELGFGLNLSRCAATGTVEDLAFVSPKSGQAVSFAAGKPYRDKLLRLPPFLLDVEPAEAAPETTDILDGLELTGHFLAKHIFAGDRPLPPARARFIDRLRQSSTISRHAAV